MLRTLVVCLVVLLVGPVAARAQDPVYDASGAQFGRGFFAPLPFERIDTVTGNVFLSFTDLSLPGNGGLGLSVVRSYNSRDGRWRIGLGGVPLRAVFNATDLSNVDFVTADGAKHNASGAGATTLTQGFWVFTKATRKVEMPNGLVLTYGHEPSSAGAYLTEVRDAFDNTITLSWQTGTGQLLSVTQHLGNRTRVVTFANWADDMASSMTFDGRTWTYTWQTISGTPTVQALTAIAPPGGTRWTFSYFNDANNAVKMQSLTTPNGGTLTYTWGVETFPTTPAQRIVIQGRTTGGRDVTPGTWSFNWQDQGRLVEIHTPVNIVMYRTLVINAIPVKTEKTIKTLGDSVLETETLTYETLPHPLNDVPGVKTVTTVRGGSTFTTTYTYSTDTSHWSNYGQPIQIVETGDLTRTTALTYQHSFSKYIRGKVASVTTTVNGQASVRSFTYDGVTGFMTASTDLGVTTTYTANAAGNTESVWDASNRRTDFTYDWGVVSGVSSPNSTVASTLSINPDGTVAWEESTGTARTTYGYDPAGRVTSVSSATAGRVPVTTTYTVSNFQHVGTIVTRGAVSVTTSVDGFGRVLTTQDSTGAQSRVTYNGGGQVTYQSRPYGTGVTEVGDSFLYDGFGRRTKVTRPNGSWVEWHYNPNTIGVQESVTAGTYRDTTQHYQWFAPGDGRMWRLVDAASGDWRYDYNGRGQLTQVSKDGDATVPTRTWTYDAQGRLTALHQPESGLATSQYNAIGNVTYTEDARGAASSGTNYSYNADHQLTFLNAPGTEDDVTTTYDSAGRTATVSNATVQTTVSYDTSSRVTGRTDVILGRTFVQAFEYDGHDHLIRADYPLTGRKVFYDYDTQQRLVAVRTQVGSGSITTLAGTFVYRGDGSLESYRYGNNALMQVDRDSRQRPTRWQSGPLDATSSYDHVGNVTSITDARGGGHSSTFAYDLLDRITAATQFGATTYYTYTPGGDRLTEGNINFHYDAATRRLMSLSVGATGSFTYNAIGSLESDPSDVRYTYTSLNMMKTSKLGVNGPVTTYAYGGGGMRAAKTGPDGTPTAYVYGAGGGPVAEFKLVGASTQLEQEYVYLGSQLLASFVPSPVAPPPLSVSILTPANNVTVTRGQTVQLTALATVGSGLTVTRVEYYNGGLLVGQSATGTYPVTLSTDLLPATNIVIARVVASNGQAVASSPITITVQ